jgi:hypothetical protein
MSKNKSFNNIAAINSNTKINVVFLLWQLDLEVLSLWSDHGTFSPNYHSDQDEHIFAGQEIQEGGIHQEWLPTPH